MKHKTKFAVIIAAAAALVIAASAFSDTDHTYTIDDEYACVISLHPTAGVSEYRLSSPGIKFTFRDIEKYFTPEDPESENAYDACAYELWSGSVEDTLAAYYRYTRCYEGSGTDIQFEVTEQDKDHAVLHYYGKGVVITSFDEETVDDHWYIDMKPFWTGEAPNVYKMELPMSVAEASDKWEAEHPDVLERLKIGDLSDYENK